MSVTVVAGVPGVGTSSLCQVARSQLGDEYELLNFGDAMLERAMTREEIESRDEVADLPLRELQLLQRRAGEYVAERARNRHVILNTRLAVATEHGIVPGLTGDVLRDVDPECFVLVEADPEAILDRRDEVESREYRSEDPNAIERHQSLNRSAAMSYSIETGSPIHFVENTGTVSEAAEELVSILTAASPE